MGQHRFRPYAGRRIALATMHGKEAAVVPAFAAMGADVVVPAGIDTDALGTFTGETERNGTMGETAVAKARLGMAASGLPVGLASEGTFGPHPAMPFLPAGMELLVLVDDTRGLVVSESLVDPCPRYDHTVLGAEDDPSAFLRSIGFPEHAAVVRPHRDTAGGLATAKGLRAHGEVVRALAEAAAASGDGLAVVQTDMRAHMNPTRMAAIARLAERLAARLSTPCPACGSPGFGQSGAETGLPCEDCATPTGLVSALLLSCPACAHGGTAPRPDGRTSADPGNCPACNP